MSACQAHVLVRHAHLHLLLLVMHAKCCQVLARCISRATNNSPAISDLQTPYVVRLARQEMSNACAELEGQGSGTGETGQDVGSPAKKMRTASGFAHGRDAGTAIHCTPNAHTLNPLI